MKWYYISHPYTGNEEENRKKAADVQRHLHEMYADIMCINPLAMFAPLADLSYEEVMTYCLEVMHPADAVIMCRGYEKSRGCMREYEAAKQEGKTILFYEGGDAPLVNIEEHEKEDIVFDSFLKDKLAERLTYVITAATTALEAIGYDLEKRRKMQERVNAECKEKGHL